MLWTVAAVTALLGIAAQLDDPGDWVTILNGLWLLAIAGLLVFLSTGSIDLYDDAAVIDGRLRRRREVPLAVLVSVEPGRSGLCFQTKDKVLFGPGCIGAKGLGLELLRVRSRGDRIAKAIMDQAARATGNTRPPGPRHG